MTNANTPRQLTEMRDALIRAGLAFMRPAPLRLIDGVTAERLLIVSDRFDQLAGHRS